MSLLGSIHQNLTADSWATAQAYKQYAIVIKDGYPLTCMVAHTSGTFATDVTLGYWQMTYPMKNHIINGNFDIWQRNNGSSIAPSGSLSYVSADRFWSYGDFTTCTLGRVSDSSIGSQYAMRMTVTSKAAGTELVIQSPLETSIVLPLQGKQVVLSAYLKPNAAYTGSIGMSIKWGTGTDEKNPTGGATNVRTVQMNTLSTSQYTRVYNTFTVPSNATSLAIFFDITAANVQDGSTIDIKSVMLNEGPAPAAFQTAGVNAQAELAMCQRYYEKSYALSVVPGTASSNLGLTLIPPYPYQNDFSYYSVYFAVPKRTSSGTGKLYTFAGAIDRVEVIGGGTQPTNKVVMQQISEKNFRGWDGNAFTSGIVAAGFPTSFHWTYDAEL